MTVPNAQFIGDEDIKAMLSKLQIEERFMKRSDSIPKKKNFLRIIKNMYALLEVKKKCKVQLVQKRIRS